MSEPLVIGDTVFIEDSGMEDFSIRVWHRHILSHRRAKICYIHAEPGKEIMYGLDFGAEFPGGIDCEGSCKPGCGQYCMAHNLSLCFEESREVITVPQIEGYNEEDRF